MKKEKRKIISPSLVLAILAAAAVILLSYFFLSVQRVTEQSMAPTVQSGDTIVVMKSRKIERGDIIACYLGNKVLIRRCIGVQGDWIDIDEKGTVSVNMKPLAEPYVLHKVSGDGDVEFPYQVPADRYFVLADNREVAADSRTSTVGCVSEKQLIGEVSFCIWPFDHIGKLS